MKRLCTCILRVWHWVVLCPLCFPAFPAHAEVEVFVQDVLGVATIQYRCTAGEVVRAFALDVSVDRGQILGISDFFVGESTATAQGYGIFPASFRDHITVVSGSEVNWGVAGYNPLAVVADAPADTLPGLNSNGVTLELGALWDPNDPAAVPRATGILCALELSEAAYVSLAANESRGGIVSAIPDTTVTPIFTGAMVDPLGGPGVSITSVSLFNGVITITFRGGELESAPTVDGEWTGTGNTSGEFSESIAGYQGRFYRVRGM